MQNNLDVPYSYFWKELLRDQGFTVGRLDLVIKGLKRCRNSPDFNAELTSWLHSFTPAINMYIRNTLNYKTDFKYNMFGPVRPGIILMMQPVKIYVRRWHKILI
jgi:hypothetical protein